jgi:hypothetical protein
MEDVEIVSLDNDLGELTVKTGEEGWHVLQWIEEYCYHNPSWCPPKVMIHSDNPVARQRMESIIKAIERRRLSHEG